MKRNGSGGGSGSQSTERRKARGIRRPPAPREDSRDVVVGELLFWLGHALECDAADCEECQRIAARMNARDYGDARALAVALRSQQVLRAQVIVLLRAIDRPASPTRGAAIRRAIQTLRDVVKRGLRAEDLPAALRSRMDALGR